MKRALVVLIAIAAFAGGYGYGRWYGKPASEPRPAGRKVLYWVDPMHPAYKSDKPGVAPDCGMKLVPVYEDEPGSKPATKKVLYYQDPKQPEYRSAKPGLNPDTGNDLVPVYEGDQSPMPPGTVHISAEKQQIIGVRYGRAEYTSGTQNIRAQGKVAMDETRVTHVHTRTEGWIEKVFVNFTGDLVRKGDPLLTIYSPELLAAQQEYLLAVKAGEIMRGATMAGAATDSGMLVAAARKRLELWSLTDRQIEQIRESGKPVTNVTLYSPVAGYVIARNAFENQKVSPDTDLYTVADLSRVWVLANVFEYEAPQVRVGQTATVKLPYAGGKEYRARVGYIQPQVDPATRTVAVRLELPNPGLALKPEMFVDVELSIPQRAQLTVPADAVLDSGLRKTVFIDRGDGYFEPREVETGQTIGDRVAILKGLTAGERVVTSGNFLINSESQLKSAAQRMAGAPSEGHAHD
jgi:Cu(I)/Ag(I) efflux system membrane fusion protein